MSTRMADPGQYSIAQAADAHLADGENGESFSVIDRHTTVDGTFHANRDLRIEGEVKGTIECQGTLFVAQGANVTAKIEAENVTVAGDLSGEVNCRGRLQIMPSGRLNGKVATQTLVINEGAFYEGQLEMVRAEERTTTRAPRPLSPVSMGGQQAATGTRRVTPTAAMPTTAPTTPSQAPAASQSSSQTFIRRFGGPETPWSGAGGEPRDEEKPSNEDLQNDEN